ncbi:hypothetical protein GOP47_0016919 [Adiantum capillus-veneris]|uniref:Uncharacterized protein n=1 Tax=Adiantum capillus-veneris TaxID=13818 RepID=A0A9D4ZB57_ADICA|nr:hypothetical protein GOP47_0016919 [Adiantum capillus-veneris]
MAGRGPRHFPKDSPHSRDGHHVKEGPLLVLSPNHSSAPVLSHQSRPDLEAPPNLMGSHGLPTPPLPVEQKMAAQQAEIQRLIGENQRLAVTHVALRQELAAAQQEVMRLQQSRSANDTEKEQRLNITQVALRQELADSKQEVNKLQETLLAVHAEKDQHLRASMEKSARLEAELKGMDVMKADFDKVRLDREELLARLEHLSAELKKIPVMDQEIVTLRREVDELRQRHQQARMDFELQKKLNLEHVEHQQAMEKSAFAMTREIERLRADLVNAERRHHAYLSATGGSTAAPSFQKSGPTAAAYDNNYGASQDALKGSSSENKSVVDISKYGVGVEPSDSRLPKMAASVNADQAGDWSKHAAPNGRSFYYNVATGATQWDKPSTAAGAVDANSAHQRQVQQVQGSATPDLNSDLTPSQHQQQVQQAVSPAAMQASKQSQSGSLGVTLLVLGLSEGISDRDLASLFHPYGAILYAKVMLDAKSAQHQFYGIVTMENAQAAEAAAVAVTGMFILGRRIKVEVQTREQGAPHQGHSQHMMQQGGVGPMRTHHRAGGPAGHWPY